MGSPNNELVTHDTPSTACFQHLQDFATIVIRRRLSEFCAQQRHLSEHPLGGASVVRKAAFLRQRA
ncbi:hypothetical protein [Adlercreutzia muris]|uniref:Uncharacterized protein n=1 Tax=Adlercreutzia muris TaxID=1796610 RepID=A0A7C8BQD0_9ACTN|nr:hypothetical protein [Adlercreutzia muris]KAB1643852.1 hypothetical protein F8D48_08545 [Adlercreutzia muris]